MFFLRTSKLLKKEALHIYICNQPLNSSLSKRYFLPERHAKHASSFRAFEEFSKSVRMTSLLFSSAAVREHFVPFLRRTMPKSVGSKSHNDDAFRERRYNIYLFGLKPLLKVGATKNRKQI